MERYTRHKITQQGLIIQSESGTEILMPLEQASKLFSAVQRATSEPPQQSDERQRRYSLQRQMKFG